MKESYIKLPNITVSKLQDVIDYLDENNIEYIEDYKEEVELNKYKEEIKEILEAIKPHDKEFTKAGIKEYSLVLSVKEQKILLDYITNLQKENNKQKEVLDKIKKYMQTLRDEYADDDYDIKCDVFNKIYYEILEEIE